MNFEKLPQKPEVEQLKEIKIEQTEESGIEQPIGPEVENPEGPKTPPESKEEEIKA